MKLYIAEKPSLARAIADALPKPHQKMDGHIIVGNGDVVSWCIGHLLEQAEPEDYDESYKKWQLQHLPIVPNNWQLKAKANTKKQLSVVKKLLKQASHIVHAGDPDREGQLLVDEVINQANLPTAKLSQTQRLLISDLNLAAVKKALNQLKPNREFIPLSVSALARSRADWLIGMNLTRAYTLVGQKAGYHGVLSVGRVQTPVLGLVVRRDAEINNFIAKPFYQVEAQIKHASGTCFRAKWQPSEACQPYMDEEGRVLNKALCENVIKRIHNQPASVLSYSEQTKKENPPLPYNLSALQIDAAKAFAMSAKQVLDTCQKLYETHKLITYPRSDNRYLPTAHKQEASDVLSAIAANNGQAPELINQADLGLTSKCWDDKKVEAHHGIIPTARKLKSASLGRDELCVYQLICRHYLAQFYPPFQFKEQKAQFEIAGGKFNAKATQTLKLGFKQLMGKQVGEQNALPQLTKGEQLLCEQGHLLEKVTEPPKHFTDATLLSAMTGVARYVTSPEIKKILKETDGLGTEATRAGIIELLFKRGFLHRQGKSILATDAGKALINSLPSALTYPDMTALWEASLAKIAQKEINYQGFMAPLVEQLNELVSSAKNADNRAFQNLPKQQKPAFKRKWRKSPTKKRAVAAKS